uniref:Rho-GAP domain-containing protein n=1 Tax=Panagrolaimus davidi TaxID=227884 RepID=A0A914QAI6_9BILA
MDKEDKPIVLFKHFWTMHQTRQAPAVCNAEKFTLENVAAYNIQIETGDTIVTLREVPRFLIEAFSKFEQLEGYKVEGVFRKEGNFSRCKEDTMPVFFGEKQISSNFLVHDVCAWIKKFFRELQQPLFANRETKLIQFVDSLHGDVLVGALLSLLDRLPASHVGTLGYLMRCLQKISEFSHLHQMTVGNLATVFAPSLFRGIQEKETTISKKRNGKKKDLLRTLKRTNTLQIQVVKVLIENAEKIVAPKYFLKAYSDHVVKPERFIQPAKVEIRPTEKSKYFPTENGNEKHMILNSTTNDEFIPASPSDHKTFDFNVNDNVFNGNEKQMILNSTSNDECHCPEMGRPSVAQIQGTGVVNRRIQQFKKLSNTSTRPTYGTISENNSNFVKPMGKPASHGLLWKKTNITDSIAEQPTKSHQFGSSRAKSVTSIYSTQQNFRDSLRPSVSATSQISSSRIKNVECGTIVSKYPKNS